MNRKAICITRGRKALVSRAKFGLTTLISGGLNCTLLKALKASARNWRDMPSLKLKFLKAERSEFHHAGAVMMSRPDVPNFSGSVAEKAFGLNQYRPRCCPPKLLSRVDAVERGERIDAGGVGALRDIGEAGEVRRRHAAMNAALPGGDRIQLPSADDQVGDSADIAQQLSCPLPNGSS